MNKRLCLIGMVSVACMMTGCATSVWERQTEWKIDPFSRTCDYSSADFEVLGPVEASGNSTVVLGMFTGGSEGYGLLMRKARKEYGDDVSTVMFIFSDYTYTGVFYPLVGTIITHYSGTAVKAKTVSHTTNIRVKRDAP